MAGIYIHIPFCKQACYYCDFHFSTNQDVRRQLVDAITQELDLQRNYLDDKSVSTIYFGGGTPTLLLAEEFHLILHKINENFPISPSAEITVEANPDDLSATKLAALAQLGINRLSIGIQSFHNELLAFLHRAHNASTALESFAAARNAGFNNISIDLIYAMPGESDAVWLTDIQQAIALQPEHISCYSLTVEEKTVFGKWASTGKLKPTEDEVAARHLETLMTHLENAGYDHYEISNFAKPGFWSNHNSSYWKQEHYLGVGPSAHSFNGVSRQVNINNNHRYIKSLQQNLIPAAIEILSRENKINEYLLTTLRTSRGTDLTLLRDVYQYDLLNQENAYLSSLVNNGMAHLENGVLTLTRSGKLLADKIASDLFILEP
jgi:oxygen-independent coproporphyrinogen III oxidase